MATTKKTAETKHCLICGQEKPSSGSNNKFYKHWDKYIHEDYGFCKQCVEDIGSQNDIKEVHRLLRLMDMPFIPSKWQECTSTENTLVSYIGSGKGLNNPRTTIDGVKICDMRYEDSPTLNQITDVEDFMRTSDENMSELKIVFGDNWTGDELVGMNTELDEMFVKYGGKKDDIATLDVYVELVLTKWLSRKAYSLNDTKTGRELSKRRSEILKENGLSLSDIKNKGDEESLGLKIDFAEDRPIIPNKKYHDVDGIKFMWDKLCKHMERFIGVEKSTVDEDYEDMQKYVDENGSYVDELE